MKIIMEDIPYDLQTMAKIVGFENFLEICRMYGGSCVYIPVYKKIVMGDRNRELVKDYNGRNVDELRFKYDMSEQQVKNILKEEGVL